MLLKKLQESGGKIFQKISSGGKIFLNHKYSDLILKRWAENIW